MHTRKMNKERRKGPRVPRQRDQRRRESGKNGEMPGRPLARALVTGPGRAVPQFPFREKMHSFRFQVLASAFKTKTNLTGSQIKGAAAAYGFAFGWSFVDLPQAANLVALFDQFRIRKVDLRLSSSRNTNTTGVGSILYVVQDYDNSNLLGSVAAAQAYQSCVAVRGSDAGEGESYAITLTPCIPIPSIAGNEVKPCPWQDCAVTTNTHYGIKGWYSTVAATDPVWDVDASYYVDMANTQ
jgi:hypothetical protein